MSSHLFDSLQSAAKLAVRQEGYRFCEINLERWALTYRSSPGEVEQAFKIAENGGRKLPEEQAAATTEPPPSEPVEEIDE